VTRTWSRIGALVAAALVGAVTVFCLTPGPRSVAPPLSATDVGFAQDMSTHHHQAVIMSDMVAADAAQRSAHWPIKSNSANSARSDR
jgi:uncharacterized protein (DUF305 family)